MLKEKNSSLGGKVTVWQTEAESGVGDEGQLELMLINNCED